MSGLNRIWADLMRALALCALLASIASARAQTPAPTSPIQLTPRTAEQRNESVRRISLVVQVTDASGKSVAGLKPTDFTVLYQNKPQSLVRFREVDGVTFSANVRVVLVLDAINGNSSFNRARKEIIKWLSQNKGPLSRPVSLALVTDSAVSQTTASTDAAAIAAELEKITRNVHGGADCEASPETITPGIRRMFDQSSRAGCMVDRFRQTLNALRVLMGSRRKVRDRTILIWLGPGWPLPAGYPANFHDVLADTITNLREAEVTIDALTWGEFEHPRGLSQPIVSVTAKRPATPDSNQFGEEEMSLPRLATESGGDSIAKVKNFSDALTSLVSGADHFYVLTFDSAPAHSFDEYHTLDVKVNVSQPPLVVHAPKAYFDEP